jgi:hypothetical protein
MIGSTEAEVIDDLISERFGLPLLTWILDVAASLRGRSGVLPIASEGIATELGLSVRCSDDPASFGSTEFSEDGSCTISIGTDLDGARRNFTLAHEIGHAVFFRATNGILTTGDELERLCDLFAAYLLAPLGYVDRQLRGPGPNLGSIASMAQVLQISERGLWLLISEHYPITFWWSRMGQLNSVGPFRIDRFGSDIDSARFLRHRPSRFEISSALHGVSEWVIEGIQDDEGAHGILKPVGRGVLQVPSVKVINLSREQMLAGEIKCEWVLHEPIDKSKERT